MLQKSFTFIFLYVVVLVVSAGAQSPVRMWQQDLTLPSYRLGPPDVNPIFYEGESYQGAQRRVYPYPLMDHLTGLRESQTFTALFLENDYIQLCILPEIGGRLFYATDKSNGHEFFYRQHVIKPALIGMLGAWISGGIEWCVFHHHRNTTHMPVDYALVENEDGSKTIWLGETERRHRMKWLIGITLFPDKSYVQATVKMINRTAQPHSILYWANVAVHVNEDYQIIFPPSVSVATFHSKNDFSRWPISDGFYRRVDYRGVDLSWWKNHPNQTSFFAWDLQQDFMGGYDHGKDAGVVHVADHHVVCGAKLWEWAPNNIWDTRILTDEDGPYAELMVGAFSDNQPDYSWIKPYEVKTFQQYWYPVREIGGFVDANLNAAINLTVDASQQATLGIHVTSRVRDSRIVLLKNHEILFQETRSLDPTRPFIAKLPLPSGTTQKELRAVLLSSAGDTLIAYQPVSRIEPDKLPDPVKPPLPPVEIVSQEDLYYTGLRLEQIYNPTVNPLEYYQEALRRDSLDVRCNIAMGISHNKRGLYREAEEHLRRAIRRVTAEYTRPRDAEAFYQLGLALQGQGREREAYDAFYRATWDQAFHAAAHDRLATLACRVKSYDKALEHLEQSLETNARNHRALFLKTAVLRKLGQYDTAMKICRTDLIADPLNFNALFELYLSQSAVGDLSGADATLRELHQKIRGEVQSYLELAMDYLDAGLYSEATNLLDQLEDVRIPFASSFPMVHYAKGYLYRLQCDSVLAKRSYQVASKMPSDYCFPFRLEEIEILRDAVRTVPTDASAPYYLGNALYDLQPDEAIRQWEKAVFLNPRLAIAHRNLGWGYFRRQNDVPKAISCYETALALNPSDIRYFLELDNLYQRANTTPQKRLQMFQKNPALVHERKPALIRKIGLLVQVEKLDEAIGLLQSQQFYTAEGGGRELHDAFVDAHLLRGLQRRDHKKYQSALRDFVAAAEYPDNLGIERPENDPRAPQVNYCIATSHRALGNDQEAERYFALCKDQSVPDSWAFARFYQGLALRMMNQNEAANAIFDALIQSGNDILKGETHVDFFAKFGEQQAFQAQIAAAHFSIALGYWGKGQMSEAKHAFQQSLQFNIAQPWANYYLSKSK